MAKLRNITDQTLEVVCNGHPRGGRMGIVEPDGLLEVDDDVYFAHAWPETVWAEVEAPEQPQSEQNATIPAPIVDNGEGE